MTDDGFTAQVIVTQVRPQYAPARMIKVSDQVFRRSQLQDV